MRYHLDPELGVRATYKEMRDRRLQIVGPAFFSGGTNPALSIYNALVAYWDFEQNDSSTAFLDSFGSNDLLIRNASGPYPSSSLSTASGVVGRALATDAVETSTRQAYIPRSNTNLDLPNSDWTVGGWIQNIPSNSSTSITMFLLGRAGSLGSGSSSVATLGTDPSTNFVRVTFRDSSNNLVDALSTRTMRTWTMFAMSLNRTQNQIEFRFRTLGDTSLTKVITAFPNPLYTAANTSNFAFNSGLASDSVIASGSRAGLAAADACYYMTKVITDTEFQYLYNSGTGKSCSQLVADAAIASNQAWGLNWGASWGA